MKHSAELQQFIARPVATTTTTSDDTAEVRDIQLVIKANELGKAALAHIPKFAAALCLSWFLF